jgi:hypothetical protein
MSSIPPLLFLSSPLSCLGGGFFFLLHAIDVIPLLNYPLVSFVVYFCSIILQEKNATISNALDYSSGGEKKLGFLSQT